MSRVNRRELRGARLAEEHLRGKNIERLEAALDEPEDPLQVRQHARRELIHEKAAARIEHRVRGIEDAAAQLRLHGAQGHAGDHIVGFDVPQVAQHLVRPNGGFEHHLQARIGDGALQEAHEVGIGLDRDQARVGAHPAQHFGRKSAHPRPVFHDDPGVRPINGLQDLVDQKARARDQRAQHSRVLQEIAGKEQQLVAMSRGAWRHDSPLVFGSGWRLYQHSTLCAARFSAQQLRWHAGFAGRPVWVE